MSDFREKAALILWDSQNVNAEAIAAIVQAAQDLADAACKAWGHDGARPRQTLPSGSVVGGVVCSRCGRVPDA